MILVFQKITSLLLLVLGLNKLFKHMNVTQTEEKEIAQNKKKPLVSIKDALKIHQFAICIYLFFFL